LADYLAQYKQAEDRVNERNNRLVDMDRHRNDLKAMMEKGGQVEPTRLQIVRGAIEQTTERPLVGSRVVRVYVCAR